jgi:[acyl-carrier-protein] S-malonyltransferase
MKTLFLFPGQGTQYVGMGKDFHDANPKVRELFELASETVKINLGKLIFEGTEDDLKKTVNTQVAVALIGRAASLMAKEKGFNPAGTAGFSLGEWPAYVEAGCIPETEMFRLLKTRGELMDKAVEKLGRPSGMSAILFLSQGDVVKALEESGLPDIYPANFNSPSQTVISGSEASLGLAEEILKAKGAKKIVRLRVSGPFHSPMIFYARDGLAEALADVTFRDPAIALYANASGDRVKTGAEAKKLAVEQVVGAVRWTDEETAMSADGYERVLETGPGTVLTGLWKAMGLQPAANPAGTQDALSLI